MKIIVIGTEGITSIGKVLESMGFAVAAKDERPAELNTRYGYRCFFRQSEERPAEPKDCISKSPGKDRVTNRNCGQTGKDSTMEYGPAPRATNPLKDILDNLMAVIHRDGGQYLAIHGPKKPWTTASRKS